MTRKLLTQIELPADPTGALEAATKQYVDAATGGPVGWQHIAAASFSAASSVTVTITASTYRMVRIVVSAVTATGEAVVLYGRVNGDTTASLHRTVEAPSFSDATVTSVVQSTVWQIGRVGTVSGQVTDLLIYNTDSSSNLPWKSTSVSVGDLTEANLRLVQAGGSLNAARTISSLNVLPASSTITGSYVAEGYLLP